MSRNFELLAQIEGGFEDTLAKKEVHRERISISAISDPRAACVDAEFINLVQRIFFPVAGTPCRRVVFCGIEQSHGSGSICERAARTLAAQTTEQVCLIDANPESSGFSHLIEVPVDEDGPAGQLRRVEPLLVGSNLWFTQLPPAAGSGAQEFQAGWRPVLDQLQRRFSYLLIDAPASAVRSEALLLGRCADAVILVLEAHATRRVIARRVKEGLEKAGVRVAGTVLTNRSFPIPRALYKHL